MNPTTKKAIIGGGAALAAGAIGYGLYARSEKQTESPAYRPVRTEGDFELRRYAPYLVAETVVTGTRKQAEKQGFKILSDYYFAKSRDGEKLDMTVPVTASIEGAGRHDFDDEGGRWAVRFVIPQGKIKASLPAPPTAIALRDMAERLVATALVNGTPSDAHWNEAIERLEGWIAERGWSGTGAFELASYNSPIIVAPIRRDEVFRAIEEPLG
ncbi:SOUL family heme-binding protein [Novosphingopyxis sp.]|uniref:SOUL family heme-binding protein n=1 Tax=Novosphingopyxis sp. TaxID=2709690 RepID=UPI003B5CEA5F